MKATIKLVSVAVALALCAGAAWAQEPGPPLVKLELSPSDPDMSAGPVVAAPRAAHTGRAPDSNNIKNLNTAETFATIGAAIADAETLAGHTLEVQVASHTEGICTVNKGVTIQGQTGTVVVQAGANTGGSGDAQGWFLMTVSDVTFKNLTFDGSSKTIRQALRFKEPGTVQSCTFQNIAYSQYIGWGVVGFKNLTVTGCSFSNIERIGVQLFSTDVTSGQISECTYTGKGDGDCLDYAVELGGGAVGTVSRCTITNCTGVASGTWTSAAILASDLYGPGTRATVTQCNATGCTEGIAVGYVDGSHPVDQTVVVANNNNLSGNTAYGLGSVATPTVDASGNWWGINTPAGVAAEVYGSVDYTPWLASGTDKEPGTPGFQGDFSTLWVDGDSPQTGTTGRVQEGIDLVTGSTVIVAAGTYTENLIVTSSDLTLESVNGPGSTTITGTGGVMISLEAGAHNFVLGGTDGKGFALTSGASTTRLVELINGPSGVEISWNDINTTGNASMGISVGAAGATNLTITNNDFTAESADGSLWGPDVVNLSVTDNDFTGPGGGAGGYAIQYWGATGTSAITGNTIDGYGNGILIAEGQSGATEPAITGNTLLNNVNALRLHASGLGGSFGSMNVSGNTFRCSNEIQVRDDPVELDLLGLLAGNTFDCAVVVDTGSPLLRKIWSSIQDAIDAASAGNTVIVAAGTYPENLTIPAGMDNLQLLGAGSATTTIDISTLGGVAIYTYSPITVKGFYITGPGRGSGTAIKIRNATSSGTASAPGVFAENKVDNVNYGMQTGDWNIVYWEFKNNDFDLLRIGIGLENMSHVVVSGNTFNDYKEGVSAGWDDDTADDVTITCNQFLGSHQPPVGDELAAIVLSSSTNRYTISHNRITDSILGLLVKDKDNLNTPDLGNVTVAYNSIAGNTTGITNEQGNLSPVTLLAENNWWGHASGPDDAQNAGEITNLAVAACTANPADEYNPGTGDPVSDDSAQAVDYCPWLEGPATISLLPQYTCYVNPGSDTIMVEIKLTESTAVIRAGQWYLWYDETKLSYAGGDPGDPPFTKELQDLNLGSGLVFYMSGVPDDGSAGPPTAANTVMARLYFDVLTGAEACDVAELVKFQPDSGVYQTKLSDYFAEPLIPELNALPTITIDGQPPVVFCPADVTVECDESTAPSNTGQPTFQQGFEIDRFGWFDFGGTLARVSSGTGGVTSATGSWHAETNGSFTRWGAYSSVFPAGGYTTAVDIYLDVSLGLPTNTRMDYISAINKPDGEHRRDFVYSAGFYDSTDPTAPGAGSDRFIMSFSNNAPGWPANPGRDPFAIVVTGWYTIEHRFYDSGAAVLAVDLNIYDAGGTLLKTWTLSDPTDIIGVTVGGNRYGWFAFMGWVLPIDNTTIQTGSALAFDNCDPDPTITYSDSVAGGTCPQEWVITRTWTATDYCGNFSTCPQIITVQDTTAPSFVNFPANVTQNADAGLCTAVVVPAIVAPTGVDNCDPSPVVTYVRSDNPALLLADPYPSGMTTITWAVTDACGNFVKQDQTVTVNAYNDLVVTVELSPTIDTGGAFPQTLTRCITFELWECDPLTGPVEVQKEVVFTVTAGAPNVAIGTAILTDVPCGPNEYDCITARDELHTLRRTDEMFGIVGTQYVADFTGDPGSGGDWLIGGNLNDDFYIDVLDFAVYSWKYGTNYGTGDTTCTTPYPHADIGGDGLVTSADFTFFQINFLLGHEANCCGQPGDAGVGPVIAISVEELYERGLGHLAAGDLNGDGWLDVDDVAAFMAGQRPKTVPQTGDLVPTDGDTR